MKTLRKFMMAMFAIATLGMAVSCEKSDASDDGNGDINGSIVGLWKVHNAYIDSTMLPSDALNLNILIKADGTGQLQCLGQTQYFTFPFDMMDFEWFRSGTTLTISTENATLTYTITKLTNRECVIKGTTVPGTQVQGDVRLDLLRVGSSDDDDDPVDPVDPVNPVDTLAFPAATNWINNYSENFTFEYEGTEYTANLSFNNTLNFSVTETTGSMSFHGSLSGNIPIENLGNIAFPIGPQTINFNYTFNANTNTGIMTGSGPGAQEESIPFTYNTTNGTIVVTLDVESLITTLLAEFGDIPIDINEIPEGVIPEQFIFTRAN